MTGTQTQPGQAQPEQPTAKAQQSAQPSQRERGGTAPTTTPNAQATGPAGGGGAAVGGSVPITQHQRAELTQRLASVNLNRIDHVGFSLAVGTVVPHSVQLYPLPPAIVSVVPAFRGYRYIAVGDRVVIVEPRTLRIITIIEQSGVREGIVGATTPPRASILISEQERVLIRERIRKVALHRGHRNVGFSIVVGAVLPPTVSLQPIPRPIVEIKPDLRGNQYVVVEKQFVVVEPQARRVVAILPI